MRATLNGHTGELFDAPLLRVLVAQVVVIPRGGGPLRRDQRLYMMLVLAVRRVGGAVPGAARFSLS